MPASSLQERHSPQACASDPLHRSLAAIALARYRIRFRTTLQVYLLLPFTIPLVVSGLGMMLVFGEVRILGQLWPVGIALCIINLPFMIWAVSATVNALDDELARAGRRLSSGLLQLVFNLPVLGILGYAGWLTALNFFAGSILSSDFFLHAFWTIVLVLFLSFFLLQWVIRLAAGKERLLERVFSRVRDAVDQQRNLSESPVFKQANTIIRLGE